MTAGSGHPSIRTEADEFRGVMSLFPTGVTVITSCSPDGPAGMTANAVASLSLDPVLMMAGFDLSSRTLEAVRWCRRFAVNILTEEQEPESRRFASKDPEPEKFRGVAHELRLGVPVLLDSAAWLICETVALYPGGDHMIGVGRVLSMEPNPAAGEPLVFHRSTYRRLDRQSLTSFR
jgi:3-hydroxy-9,10-secoandrosta-1,3,5(10)-triene-9,17-dione monooxygenase reductase component